MKKTSLVAIATALNTVDFADKDAIMEELTAEINRDAELKAQKASEYEQAWAVVREILAGTNAPLTVSDIYEECRNDLPEGFGKGRVQYGMTHNWAEMLVKIEGKPNTYRLA